MRCVIIRDDDTNALTPVKYLERLYRPFLDRGLPVNLATIPNVATDARMPDGRLEGFLVAKRGETRAAVPITSNPELIQYLLSNPGFEVIQHGYHHDYLEFERHDAPTVRQRLDDGTSLLREAGFASPKAFVAPYDKISRSSYRQLASRFRIISTGWFELKRLPFSWWPLYVLKKARGERHWRVGNTLLLSHPGCLLSCHRPYAGMVERVRHHVYEQELTVLVTHWWEYFRDGRPDEAFIENLHGTAEVLALDPEIRVLRFSELAACGLELRLPARDVRPVPERLPPMHKSACA